MAFKNNFDWILKEKKLNFLWFKMREGKLYAWENNFIKASATKSVEIDMGNLKIF